MLPGLSPTVQALLATCFTWFVTALGAALVFLVPRDLSERRQRMLLDGSLGFAAGVMLAASYWSLLAPALEFAETSGTYGAHTYIPVCIGLLAGAAFVWGADQLIPHGAGDAVAMLTQQSATNTSNGSVGRTDGRSKKHDSEDEQTSQRLLQHQHQPPPPPPLQRAGSLSRKRNISSGRLSHILSDEAFDDMEAHRMPPTHAAGMGGGGGGSGGGKGNKLKQSPPPAGVLPGSGALTRSQSRSGSGKKGGGRASSSARLMSDMVPVDEVAEHDGLPVVWNSQQQRPFTTHSSSSGQDGLARDQQQQQQSQSQLQEAAATLKAQSWRRILLLVIAIVIHNFPEGLAVGVGFGALNDLQPVSGDAASTDAAAAALSPEEELSRQSAYAARFSEAVTLAFGIGLQNFPEGLAVSLPLLRVGFSRSTAFMYGQLSGMVEPLGGLLGAALVGLMQPILPYALAFAAGAMIFVVVEDLIPETRSPGGFPQLASAFVMVGFCTMMSMDVFFG